MKLLKTMLCALLLGLLTACSGNSPEGLAESFVAKTYAGDADAVLALIDIPDEVKAESGAEEVLSGKIKAGVAQEKRKAENWGGIDKITVLKFEPLPGNDNRGAVTVQTSFKGGHTETDRINVIRTEDGWKITL